MISGWWLFLIVPVCVLVGIVLSSLCFASSNRDSFDNYDDFEYDNGL